VDWDKDGNVDILSGCYWSMDDQAGHIEMLAGQGDMDFAAATPLLTSSGIPVVNVRRQDDSEEEDSEEDSGDDSAESEAEPTYEWRNICTQQHAVDYDGDGDLDLVTGCMQSEFFFVENSEEDGVPALSDNPVQLEVTVPGGHSAPHLADWDGDGDLDLLSGSSSGGVYLSENIGTRQVPEWAPFQPLIESTTGIGHEQTTDGDKEIVPSSGTRIWTTDWNGDGQLDLLVGDNVTISNRNPDVNEEEYGPLMAEYEKTLAIFQKAYMELFQEYQAAAEEEGGVDEELTEKLQAMSQEFQEAYASKSKFQDARRTGFVWLYIRKTADAEPNKK